MLFTERKKADRLAKQLRNQLGTTTDEEERKKLEADLHVAEIDALYAKYFPHRERYISLYPVSSLGSGVQGEAKAEDASSAARSLHAERPPLWDLIESTAKKGTSALVRIQERKPAGSSQSKPPAGRLSKHSSAAKPSQPKAKPPAAPESSNQYREKNKRQKAPEPSDLNGEDDSDGGFFEDG